MDSGPWSSYSQHYSRLGGPVNPPDAGASQLGELNLPSPLERQEPVAGYSGAGPSTHHPLFLSNPRGLNASQNATHQESSFNSMNLLSPNYDSSLLSSSFQHSSKSHFAGLPPSSSHGSGNFYNKDDAADLRGGFVHRSISADSGQEANLASTSLASSTSLFDSHIVSSTSSTWRSSSMAPSSCGAFGILPHEAVMQNGNKFAQQQQNQTSHSTFGESDTSRPYSSILPSPSRPPSNFGEQNSVPHTASLSTHGESQYFNTMNDGFYPCNKTGNEGFTPYRGAMSPSGSTPSSQHGFTHTSYSVDKEKSLANPSSIEPFSPNPGVIVNHVQNGQSSSTSSVSSRPGVTGTPGSSVCQNSPNPSQHQPSPHMPGYNTIQNYPYPSPSSQTSMSPSVMQSPQHQPDSRGISMNQKYIGSNQPSPSVHHSPYPSMGTPASASTPIHITPPSSIGQAYCPMNVSENSPRAIGCTSIITNPGSSANYSSVQDLSPKDINLSSQHSMRSDPLQLGNAHYIPQVENADENCMSGIVRPGSGLSAINAMVEKHHDPHIPGTSDGLGRMMPLAKSQLEMNPMYNSHEMAMLSDYDEMGMGSKSGMLGGRNQSQSINPDTGLHPAMADYQTIPPARKRGRGRPRGSVNKRGRRGRRGKRGGGQFPFEGDRYIDDPHDGSSMACGGLTPSMHMNPTLEPGEMNPGALRNQYSSRLQISRAPHNRVFTSRKDMANYNMANEMKPDIRNIPHQPSSSYMTMQQLPGDYQSNSSLDEAKVFNFEDNPTNVLTPFSKFMSEARGEASTSNLGIHPHSSMNTNQMMMPNCPSNEKCPPSQYLNIKTEVDPLTLLSSDLEGSEQQHQSLKPKNYIPIEEDLGFLAELPPIESQPSVSDPSGSKSGSKDPGGFLQSFLSFIEGSAEPAADTGPTTQYEVPSSEGRRGSVRGRRGRGARGRSCGRRRGMAGLARHSLDQRAFDWESRTDLYPKINNNLLPPPINLKNHADYTPCSIKKRAPETDLSQLGGEDNEKDSMVPNPEAPSFSSDDEDNTSGGIADSVAFVIRRLSEDEPPASKAIRNCKIPKNQLKTQPLQPVRKAVEETKKIIKVLPNKFKSVINGNTENTNGVPITNGKRLAITTYRKRGRKPKTSLATISTDSNSMITKITLKPKIPVYEAAAAQNDFEETGADSYDFVSSGMMSPRRTTSMRRCKAEMMKKREEKLEKKKQSKEEKKEPQPLDELGSSGDEIDAAEESDSDPAWTPSKVGPIDNPPEGSKNQIAVKQMPGEKGKKKKKRLNVLSLPQKLSLKFTASKPVNGEIGNNNNNLVPGVIHLLKEGRVYTRVKESPLREIQNESSESAPPPVKDPGKDPDSIDDENKFEENSEDDCGNDSDSSSGSSFKDETGSGRLIDDKNDILEGFFRTGDFLIDKNDIEISEAPLWQIEGKSLLQRFDTFEKDGRILYRNASTYSAWNPSLKNKYLGVTVRLLYASRAYTIAEYLGLSSTDIPDMKGEKEENLDIHPQRENFEVFLQTLISQVLDPNFIAEIVKENDEYFLSHLKGMEDETNEKKMTLLNSAAHSKIKDCVDSLPCVNISPLSDETDGDSEKKLCNLCDKDSPAQHNLHFHGQCYDPVTLSNKGPPQLEQPDKIDFSLCSDCNQAVVLYHRLHHHKYNFFLQCHSKVAKERPEGAIIQSHIVLEQCLQDTQWVNEMFSEMQDLWSACEKPR